MRGLLVVEYANERTTVEAMKMNQMRDETTGELRS